MMHEFSHLFSYLCPQLMYFVSEICYSNTRIVVIEHIVSVIGLLLDYDNRASRIITAFIVGSVS